MSSADPDRARIAVLAHVIVDDVTLPSGRQMEGQLGGSAIYAAAGVRLVGGTRPGIVCGVGSDFEARHREWLAQWDVDDSAMLVRGELTPRTTIHYAADGSRVDSNVLDSHEMHRMSPHPDQIPESFGQVIGVYAYQRAQPAYFRELAAVVPEAAVLWEVSARSCQPEFFDDVVQIGSSVDWVSVNLAEATELTGYRNPMDCLARFREAGVHRLSLRMGAQGTLLSQANEVVRVGATPVESVIDPTGAGNSHGAALLTAWLQKPALGRAGQFAAAAASIVIEQFGPPAVPVSPEVMAGRVDRTTVETVG